MSHTLLLLPFLALLMSCNNATEQNNGKSQNDTVRISVDESFKPVMAEEIKVFESNFPQTIVIVTYKPEADCFRDLAYDSIRAIFISRELSRTETGVLDKTLGYKPEFSELAKDAIAVIANANNADSIFTLNYLKKLLSDTANKNVRIAVDGKNATSTVRYLHDSLLYGKPFSPNVSGAKSSEDLIKYIAETPNSIGFAGISWLTNPQSKQQEQAVEHVKLCMLECNTCDSNVYAKPSQQTITFNQYPLVRRLYYVLKENYAGVASRFIHFLSTERGQLIFRRALLVPSKMQFNRRKTSIKEAK